MSVAGPACETGLHDVLCWCPATGGAAVRQGHGAGVGVGCGSCCSEEGSPGPGAGRQGMGQGQPETGAVPRTGLALPVGLSPGSSVRASLRMQLDAALGPWGPGTWEHAEAGRRAGGD